MASGNSTRRHPRFIDLTGKTFGRWYVIGLHSVVRGKVHWLCRCDCGTVKPVVSYNLRAGNSRGCLRHGQLRHGRSGSPEHYAWKAILARCGNPHNPEYYAYGGRGITVCARWLTFENFFADMSERPSAKHSIDRIDNNGNYEPSNCRWATRKQQARNTSRNVNLTLNGRTMCLTDWCKEFELPCSTLRERLKHCWSVERALTTPA